MRAACCRVAFKLGGVDEDGLAITPYGHGHAGLLVTADGIAKGRLKGTRNRSAITENLRDGLGLLPPAL